MMKGTMAVDVSQDWATTCDVQQRFMHHAVPPADGISYAALANLDLISFKCKEASVPARCLKMGVAERELLAQWPMAARRCLAFEPTFSDWVRGQINGKPTFRPRCLERFRIAPGP